MEFTLQWPEINNKCVKKKKKEKEGEKGKINSHCDSTNRIKLVELDSECLGQRNLQGSIQGRTGKSCHGYLGNGRVSHLKQEWFKEKARHKKSQENFSFL